MLELFLVNVINNPAFDFANSGPGPKSLQSGNKTIGFFGEVAPELFITGTQALDHIGLTAGTNRPNNATTPWLKILYRGKVLFMPRDTLKSAISWEQIYAAGAMYGVDGVGNFPYGTPTNQYKPFKFMEGGRELTFIPRTIMGAATDPTTTAAIADIDRIPNEWFEIMGGLTQGSLASYTMTQLGQTAFNTMSHTQTSAYSSTASSVSRGNNSTYNTLDQVRAKNYSTNRVWKPIFELVID